MKRLSKVVYLLLSLCIVVSGFASASESENIRNYGEKKGQAIALGTMRSEGNFGYSTFLYPPQLLLPKVCAGYLEKRYTKERMIADTKQELVYFEDRVIGFCAIYFVGDWMSKGTTDKTIPSDFAEYIFLENDKGDYVRCSKADVPLFSTVNIANKSVVVSIEFPIYYEKDSKQVSIFENTEYVEIVVGGLGLKNNRFRQKLPLYEVDDDIPQLLKEIFIELDMTTYP